MDITTIGGLILGVSAIIVGQMLEGGTIGSLIQPTAALIVFGGTAGAVVVSFPLNELISSIKLLLSKAVLNTKLNTEDLINEIVDYANRARKEGILSLENALEEIKDPIMFKGLRLVIDGVEPTLVRDLLETELGIFEEHVNQCGKVLEAAGGYAPTVGIIGAVLGLIHVMQNLSNPEALGGGIAVAFVATVYGVGAANLALIPLGTKIKRKGHVEVVLENHDCRRNTFHSSR